MKKLTLPKELASLSEKDLETLNDWLDEHPRRVVHEKLLEKFSIKLTTDKLYRYDQKRLTARALTESTDLALDVHDYLELSNGQPTRFGEASLILIQKRVFELAADRQTKPGLLKDLFRIATYADRKDWQEHRKEINTQRLALDKRKQDLSEKQFRHQVKIDKIKFPAPEKPKILTTEQQTERMWEIFHVPEEERIRRRAVNAARAAAAAAAAANNPAQTTEGAQSGTNPAEVAQASLPAGPEASSLDSASTPNTDTAHPNSDTTHAPEPTLATPQFAAAKVSLGDQTGGGLGKSTHSSLATNHCSLCASGINHLSTEPLTKRSNDYTIRRAKEYWSYRREESAWYALQAKRPYAAGKKPQYISHLRECPCGAALPCPHHEEFLDRFWTVSPYDGFYMMSLLDRGIPYREPREFLA
jgi:hypothetical protein